MKCLFALSFLLLPIALKAQTASAPPPPAPIPTAAAGDTQPEETHKAADPGQEPAKKPSQGSEAPTATKEQLDALQTQIKAIRADLAAEAEDPTFALTLGVGSLVLHSGVTDYSNNSNVLQANNLGRATPQYLVGVSMRSEIPNFRHDSHRQVQCAANPKTPNCQIWRRQPWSGFVSLKFSPSASQTINGYVIGGSYAITSHLNALIGYALTPVNEPSPGFRVTASQFVTTQQAQGQYLNFNPTAMLNDNQNAFDGFSIADPTGKLIYKGNPLTVHYRGGVVFGISIPVAFSSFLGPKKAATP